MLWEVACLFFRLGTTAFGGPAAHIGMMEDEVVRRRGWITRERFLDLLGATNLIPGPNSTEMAIHIGYLRAGWAGLLVAGVCFIVPAMAIVTAIAWAYVQFGSLPEFASLLYGVKPVVIAIVAQALWGLSKTAVKTHLDGVNVASLALMAVVTWHLGRAAIVDLPTVLLALVSAILLIRFRVNSLWLILGGALVGSIAAFVPGWL